jgi:tRNA A37 threonylcarbamoyladenosine modification protein TsaB
VPSLLGTAWIGARFADGPIAALYDALRGDVYGAVYAFGDRVRVLLEPTVAPVRALADRVPAVSLAVGDGAARYPEDVRRWTGSVPVGPPMGSPRAAALLALADLPGASSPVPDITRFEPTYGRPAEAQARWERQHGRPLPDSPGRAI